ncbi:MAG: Ig-like domain-containing protein [Candidatus Omnitrophica bacterium]|nr:Ig-like domain-containing protein [Candidatus Omnitrophota bacterium]
MKKAPLILFLYCMMAIPHTWADPSSIISVKVEIDSNAPKTQAVYDNLWHNADFTIDLIVSDSESGIDDTYYRINDGLVQSVKIAGYPVISTEGAGNMLEYWSIDKIGNEELPHNILTEIKLDKTAPSIKITNPNDETCYSSGPITITGTVSDILSGIKGAEIKVGDTPYNISIQVDGSFTVSDIDIVGGPNSITAIAQDEAGNEDRSGVTVFLGWLLHLKVPYYNKSQDYYSAAASCQSVLNYIRDGLSGALTQDEIYSYGHTHNHAENTSILEMDPNAVDYALGHFDPYDISDPAGQGDAYKAYNFDVEVFENSEFNKYLRDIVHWMAYPVTIDKWWLDGELVMHPNVPIVAPACGTYNHWIVINGASASQNPVPEPHTRPWYTPDFTVYGLWLTDPASEGIGKDIYVAASTAQTTYLLPVVSSDRYNDKYLHVAEPPEILSEADVAVAEPNVNKQTLKLIEIIKEINSNQQVDLSTYEGIVENAKKHIYDAALVVDLKNSGKNADIACSSSAELLNSVFNSNQTPIGLDWTKIIDSSVLTDEDFKKAFDGSQARTFIGIRRADKENSFYYLIPFDKYVNGQFLTYAAITIDSETGSFEEASWVKTPTRFVQIGKNKARELLLLKYPDMSDRKLDFELIWQPGAISDSPFYPYWKILSGSRVYFVTQNSEVLEGT